MKKLLLITMIFAIIISARWQAWASIDARRVVDNMYAVQGHLPINDLVADIEVYSPREDSRDGQLELTGKDKIVFKKPNKLKIDSIINDPGGPLDGKQMTIIRDGTQKWLYVSAGQYPVKKGPDEPYATLNLPPNIQVYPQHASNEYRLLGEEVISGVKTLKIEVNYKSTGEISTLWIDPIKSVPLKMEIKSPDAKDATKYNTTVCLYKDFKQLKDARWVPFRIEMQKDGQTVRLIVYKALSVNVGIQDHLFEPMDKFIK